jgi:hypothetical protein
LAFPEPFLLELDVRDFDIELFSLPSSDSSPKILLNRPEYDNLDLVLPVSSKPPSSSACRNRPLISLFDSDLDISFVICSKVLALVARETSPFDFSVPDEEASLLADSSRKILFGKPS